MIKRQNRKDRPKNFFSCNRHIRPHIRKDRGLDKSAGGARQLLASNLQTRTGSLTVGNIMQYFIELLVIHDRPDLGFLIQRVTDFYLANEANQTLNEIVVDRALN